jgi:predicted esterase
MKRNSISILFLLLLSIGGISQTITPGTKSNRNTGAYYDMTSFDSSPFEEYTYTSPVDSLGWINFRMLKPKNYTPTPTKLYPLFVFFHGYGEAGRRTVGDVFYSTTDPQYDNNDHQLKHCGPQHIAANGNGNFPGFVIFPQNDYGSWIEGNGFGSESIHKNLAKVIELIEKMMAVYPIDPFRIYVNGLSNGGGATWTSIYKRPDLFAAAAPMSAPGDTSMIPFIGNIPVWIFQGGVDTNPPTWRSDLMFKEMNKKFGDIRYTLYPLNGHDTWNSAYSEPDFFSWFLSKSKTDIHIWGPDSTICAGSGVRLSVSPGFDQYEWSNGATTNEIFATTLDTYRVRIRKGTLWSDWSKPVIIKQRLVTEPATIIPAQSIYLPSPASSSVILSTSLPYESYIWSNGATTPTITATSTTLGSYTVKVKATGKCESTTSIPIVVRNTNTTGRPNLPISIVPTTMSENTIKLNWTDNNTTEIGVEIFRSTISTGGYKFVGIAPANATQFVDEGLAASTDYYYRIRAINNLGASNTSVFVTAKTNADVTPPTAPSNLTITIGATAILNWDAATDNVGVFKYLIYKNGVLSDSTVNLTYTAKNLTSGARYVFTIRAKDQTKNLSPFSNQVSGVATSRGIDYSFYLGTWDNLPTFSSLTPSITGIVNNFSIDLSPVADNFAFKFQGYIKINKTGTYTFFTKSDDGSKLYIGGFAASNEVVKNDYRQSPTERSGTKAFSTVGYYPIYVTYFERAGGQTLEVRYQGPTNSGIAKQLIPDSVLFRGIPPVVAAAPTAPTNVQLSLSTITIPKILVSWTKSATGLKTEVYRSLSPTSGFSLIKIVGTDTTSFQDLNFSQGFTYYYKLKATGANGESSFTPTSSLFVALFPTAASDLIKTNVTEKSVALKWVDNATNETSYLVQRKIQGANFATIATLSANTTSYIDTNQLIPANTYSYRVIAANGSGNSYPSNELEVLIPLPTIAYQGDWKMAALQAFDSYSSTDVTQALLTKQDYVATTNVTTSASRTITMQLPAMPEGGMMIYNIQNNVATSLVKLFVSTNSTNGTDGTWNEVAGSYLTERDDDLQKVDFPIATSTKWYKVQFVNNGTEDIVLKEMGLYAFKPGVRHNYILLLGASIEEAVGGSFTDFKNEILAQYPSSQPVVFNLSESGSFSGDLLAKLQSILDRHPKAGYTMIHMGGNDVTTNKPLTYSKLNTTAIQNTFLGNLSDIITRCQNAGKITVHARISFRDYRTAPTVNGGLHQENGSLPFNILFDKVLRQLTPTFYDTTERRPRMDLYEATLNDQSIIAGDGIHPTGTRGIRLIRKWVNSPIRYFYTGMFPAPIAYTEFNPNLSDSAEAAVIKSEISKSGEDIFNARIIVEQLSNTSIRVPLHKRLDLLENGIFPSSPNAPTSFSFSNITTKSVQLNWLDNATNETYYSISKSVNDTSNYQVVNTFLKPNTNIFIETNLKPHTKYFYKVAAGNSGGLSSAIYSSVFTNNSVPVVSNIEPILVVKSQSYAITAPVTDSDNDSLTIIISNAPNFVSTSGKRILITPQAGDVGNYSNIRLVVTDGFGGYDTTFFAIKVLEGNQKPVIATFPDKSLYELDVNTFTFSAFDADNDSLTWTVDSAPSFATFTNLPNGKLKVVLSPSLTHSGVYTIITTVKDTKNASVKDTIKVTVVDLVPNILYRVNAGGSDITASPLNWLLDKQGTPISYFDAANSGNYTAGGSSFSYQNTTSAPNGIFGPYRIDALIKGPINYKFPVTDSKYQVNLFFAEPTNTGTSVVGQRVFHINLDNIRVLSNLDPFAEAGFNAVQKQFIVNVTDGILDVDLVRYVGKPVINGLEITKLNPASIIVPVNTVPYIAPLTGKSLYETDSLQISLFVADADNDSLTISILNAPGFVKLIGSKLTINPLMGNAGVYPNIKVKVSDGKGGKDSTQFTLTVLTTGGGIINTSPIITSITNKTLYSTDSLIVPILASDSDNDALTFTLNNAPAFVTKLGTQLVIKPLVGDTGIYSNLKVVVSDGKGGKDSTLFALTVLKKSTTQTNATPTIQVISDKTLSELDSLIFNYQASDSDGDSLVWTVDTAPVFASFVTISGGKLKVTMKPTLEQSGVYTLIVKVTDTKGAKAIDTLKVTVLDLVTTVLYRINAGGPTEIVDSPMNWEMDKTPASSYLDLVYSNNYTAGGTGFNFLNETTAPRSIFGPYRYDNLTKGPIKYKFPVSNGKYIVNLFFAETPYNGGATAVGQKIFHINVDGIRVLSNFDPFAEGGRNAIQKQFIVSITDGMLEVELPRSLGKPYINGLEIIQLGNTNNSNTREGDFGASTNFRPELVDQEFSISPNPVSDMAYLTGFPRTLEGNARITVLNEVGNRVYENLVFNVSVTSAFEIPFGGLSAGFYILKVEFPDGTQKVKTIIKK